MPAPSSNANRPPSESSPARFKTPRRRLRIQLGRPVTRRAARPGRPIRTTARSCRSGRRSINSANRSGRPATLDQQVRRVRVDHDVTAARLDPPPRACRKPRRGPTGPRGSRRAGRARPAAQPDEQAELHVDVADRAPRVEVHQVRVVAPLVLGRLPVKPDPVPRQARARTRCSHRPSKARGRKTGRTFARIEDEDLFAAMVRATRERLAVVDRHDPRRRARAARPGVDTSGRSGRSAAPRETPPGSTGSRASPGGCCPSPGISRSRSFGRRRR